MTSTLQSATFKPATHPWPESNQFWRNKRVTVTGGAGFLGSTVVEKLQEWGAAEIIVPRRSEYDPSALLRTGLRDIVAIRQLFADVHNSAFCILHSAFRIADHPPGRQRGKDGGQPGPPGRGFLRKPDTWLN